MKHEQNKRAHSGAPTETSGVDRVGQVTSTLLMFIGGQAAGCAGSGRVTVLAICIAAVACNASLKACIRVALYPDRGKNHLDSRLRTKQWQGRRKRSRCPPHCGFHRNEKSGKFPNKGQWEAYVQYHTINLYCHVTSSQKNHILFLSLFVSAFNVCCLKRVF